MKRIYKKLLASVSVALILASCTTTTEPLSDSSDDTIQDGNTPELDNDLVSVSVDGIPYKIGNSPLSMVTDQVFLLSVTVKNTGTASWSQYEGGRGSTLFSRTADYNSDYGTYFISPGQGQDTKPDDEFTYFACLRAPGTPGSHAMHWQAKDWIILDTYKPVDYTDTEWFGALIRVNLTVTQRKEQPPTVSHVPGILDASDFEYEGSFTLPVIPRSLTDKDLEKTFTESGIAMRKTDSEKRLILSAGTYEQVLYEIALPERLKKIIGNETNDVPIAEFRGLLGTLPRHEEATRNGSMWYAQQSGLLYWTNLHQYWVTSEEFPFPVLRAGKIENGALVPVGEWYLPTGLVSPMAYWGGVTNIPGSFAASYTGGRTLALGFGGSYSATYKSWGPALAAVSVPDLHAGGGTMDLKEIFHFGYKDGKSSIRDGNYLIAGNVSVGSLPESPWKGTWTRVDEVRTGVFIDLPDKKGYITFTRLGVDRVGYDYGGYNWGGKYENCWYFYDYDTLGKTANGEIAHNEIQPLSVSNIVYPYEKTSPDQWVTGSFFDPDTRLLYLYVLGGNDFNPKQGMYNDPIIHVYRVN